jgi:hypothetical protein
MAHVQGDDDGSGFGVEGTSTRPKGTGVYGYSETGPGVCGLSIGPVSITGIALDPKAVTHGHPPPIGTPMPPPLRTAVYGVTSLGQNTAGVLGQNDAVGGYGMLGMSDKGHGVRGLNDTNSGGSGMQPDRGSGASGDSTNGYGVWGASKNWAGVFGGSVSGEGVHGETNSTSFAAVAGIELNPSSNIAAVYGEQRGNGPALYGTAKGNGAGVFGGSANGEGVHGETNSTQFAAVAGIELNQSSNIAAVYGEQRGNGPGVYGIAKGKGAGVFGTSTSGPAGYFQGDVFATGTVTANDHVCAGGDCAEDFDVVASEQIEPGSVMVIDEDGYLKESREAYDKRVAGVVSGGGDYKPGILLDKKPSAANRLPVALVGKVFCKVDAGCTPIEVGDLLTTSATAGHAMKALEPLHAFGAVIGKALRPLKAGRGLIPILVALQ